MPGSGSTGESGTDDVSALPACTRSTFEDWRTSRHVSPAEAAGEFQRILDHRSVVLVDPMDAMARLQLARALALAGDGAKAKRAYEDLFVLWKNADPDVPVLRQARAEYVELR
jgi:DNA-binding SARP family transcriptional activator